jgi:Ni/Co efflux regulator RcnB
MRTNCALAFVVAGILAAGPAVADKPSGAGGGKGNDKGNKSEQRDNDKGSSRDNRAGPQAGTQKHFGDQHRTFVHDYYSQEFKRGHCPPGLAKKHNGCMPPGQAKKWTMGRPLPRDVIFYDLPPALVAQFGRPPAGHRYVRVADDILTITSPWGTVIDAILNLGRV